MHSIKMAICGLMCEECPILKASFGDMEAAESLAGWWKNEGWMDENATAADVIAKGPHCLGCHGDRAKHWSANCWILQCCVDDRKLDYCYECVDFPCKQLENWSTENEHYSKAFKRLLSMREA
jgi:hypothetical protein